MRKQTHCECCKVLLADCRVMRELGDLRTADGKAKAASEYRNELRKKLAEKDNREVGELE